MQELGSRVESSELSLREQLSALERDWLRGCLVSNVGVHGASYSEKDPHRLVVEYDPDLMNGNDLLDILYLRGMWAELRSTDLPPRRT